MAQLVACSSEIGYKAVCKTDRSYVLKRFHDSVHLKSYSYPLTVENVNDQYEYVCRYLNEEAEQAKYVNDIELKDYDVLTDSDEIKALLSTINIGFKIKTDKSSVIRTMRDNALAASNHFNDIKACLGTETSINHDEYKKCIKKLHLIGESLSGDSLSNNIVNKGGADSIDDIDLKIELNRWLNTQLSESTDTSKPDIPLDLYDWNLSNEKLSEIIKLTQLKIIFSCVKVAFISLFTFANIVVLIALYFNKKSTGNDEEKSEA